jgi:hypothetical protein
MTIIPFTQDLDLSLLAAAVSGAATVSGVADNSITDAKIATQTTTKITTSDKSLLNSAIVYNDQANIMGNFLQTFGGATDFEKYYDIKQISAPSAPASGYTRFYIKTIDSSNDGLFCQIRKGGSFVEVQVL